MSPIIYRDIDVLVIPTRPVSRLADLDTSELASLMTSVQQVGNVIEKVYQADGLTIACQVSPSCALDRTRVHHDLFNYRTERQRDSQFLTYIFTFFPANFRATDSQEGMTTYTPNSNEPRANYLTTLSMICRLLGHSKLMLMRTERQELWRKWRVKPTG